MILRRLPARVKSKSRRLRCGTPAGVVLREMLRRAVAFALPCTGTRGEFTLETRAFSLTLTAG